MITAKIAPNFPYSWRCPYCHRDCTISVDDEERSIVQGHNESLFVRFIKCPSAECKKTTLKCYLFRGQLYFMNGLPVNEVFRRGKSKSTQYPFESWNLLPVSSSKPLPDCVPESVRKDYEEACSTKDPSPKSAATLARRCIQVILRDFFNEKANTIKEQMDNLKNVTNNPYLSPSLLQAFEMIRKFGNIGAHPPKDINAIVAIDEGEAERLIEFVEFVIEQTYTRREYDEKRLAEMKESLEVKEDKNSGKGKPKKQNQDGSDVEK